MLLNKKSIISFIILIFFFNKAFAGDIPVIVIAPSKKPQSLSTVGSSVQVFTEQDIAESNDYFLGDVLSGGVSTNFNQHGGPGTLSGIQLRGIPKNMSTVYIDGVRMSDNSTPKNDYYMDDILSNQISRVEILKGNQSSIYGSGAMGGTINITTKRGKPGFQRNFFYNTGSYKTHNMAYSIGGADSERDFYIGLERFYTDGESAMMHNDEKDSYKNHSLLANYGYHISDEVELRTNYRFIDARLEYDAINDDYSEFNDKSHEKESVASVSLFHNPSEQLSNSFTISNAYSSRTADGSISSFASELEESNYWSYRSAVNYMGSYNFNLDNSLTFGAEGEWNETDIEEHAGGGSKNKDDRNSAEIFSQFIDYQSRITKNLYATIGLRFDDHSMAGNEDSERITLAYLFDDKNTKLKTTYGTGIKFPSLYEFYTKDTAVGNGDLVAETGESFDIGIEKFFPSVGFNLDLTYFNHSYQNTIEGWKTSNWAARNRPGKVRSQGIELISKFKLNEILNFDLNYTYNSTYDGADFDDPDMGPNSQGLFTNEQLARVPRHLINLDTRVTISDAFNLSLQSKWSDSARDYNNINVGQSSGDKRLSPYMVNDLSANYNVGDDYRAFLKIGNIFDVDYETALEYRMPPRTVNFGIKRDY